MRYYNAAIEIPSPAITRMEQISQKTGVFLVIGVIEKEGGTCYCTIVFIHPENGYIAKHRKVMPTAAERLVWGFGDGSTLPVLENSFSSNNGEVIKAKLSATICW